MFPHPTTTTLKRALIFLLRGFRAGVQRPDSTTRRGSFSRRRTSANCSSCARRLEYPLDLLIMAKGAHSDRFRDLAVHGHQVLRAFGPGPSDNGPYVNAARQTPRMLPVVVQ
jgi:hypothetical protein